MVHFCKRIYTNIFQRWVYKISCSVCSLYEPI